ncbi:MAG: heavy metal translocating P-type ATPase [Clostridiales bacterium]|nr:heavy metal translocating P-type ATPase [Clostridiales bacterium]
MTRRNKKNLIRIVVSAVLLAAAWLIPADGVIKLLIFFVPYGLIGWDVLWNAARNIVRGQVFDENFLMALATVGAFATGDYPEAVAVMLFYQVGELFQKIAVGKSRRSIAALMDIRPDHANVIRGGEETEISPEEVAAGETILVKPGERIPLDGVIISGSTSVDTAALTGESVPRACSEGDQVVSGTVNLTSPIQVRTTSVYGESTVSRILELVENASAKKSRSERFITRFARWYTPCVVIAAALLAVVPPLVTGGGWTDWIHRGLIFLVVSCPCALVISVPLSFFGGIGGASRCGILVKGSNSLEALAKVGTVVFDKTGTLTEGRFSVSEVRPTDMSEEELLALAALTEAYSNHPIAESIISAWGGTPDKSRISSEDELPGLGIRAVVDGETVCAGNAGLMELYGAEYTSPDRAGTVVHLCRGSRYLGHIIISDAVKPDSKAAMDELHALGAKNLVMLTGDSASVAREVGTALGLDSIHAELLPDQKVACVEELLTRKAPGSTLVFVGDGINDAPVLARSDIGIAMGALGSDAAIEAADVVLMDDKPSKVALGVRLARRTMRIVRQNIVFALGVKGVVLALSALGLTNMWVAVFADVGVAVIAILNAMRALRIPKQK